MFERFTHARPDGRSRRRYLFALPVVVTSVALSVSSTAAAAPSPTPSPSPSVPSVQSTSASSTSAPSTSAGSPALPGAGGAVGINPADVQCPLGWPKPKLKGGLASLILLAPAAGAFTDEAFAAGQAYDPVLSLAGPFLAAAQPQITGAQPALKGPVGALNAGEQNTLNTIKPFYQPYRKQLIEALTKAGNDMTPVLQEMAASPLGACLVAWEYQVVVGLQTGHYSTIATTGLGRLGAFARSSRAAGRPTP
ncbi:hypothetical protein [Tsukamurella soli]|uniref:Uncharacterized protein n=1 Tax=Tsukamurella soli TaxID=644556 RepID=A0ABP8KFK7_9ACTN